MDNTLQNEDEVIFIGDPTQTINIHKHSTNDENLESMEISCVFCFHYDHNANERSYGKLMRDMLIGLLYAEIEKNSDKELFYSDENGVFEIYMHSDSSSILKFANMLSEALPLGLCFTFKSITPLSDDEFMRAKNCNINQRQEFQNLEFLKQDSMRVPNVLELHSVLDKFGKSYRMISPFVRIDSCSLPSLESCPLDLLQNLLQNGLIEALAEKLMQDGSITLQRNGVIFTLSLNLPKSEKSLESESLKSLESEKDFKIQTKENYKISSGQKIPQEAALQKDMSQKTELQKVWQKDMRKGVILESKLNFATEFNLPKIMSKITKKEPTPFVLLSTLDTAKSYFRMSEAQKSMLASFEKPFIKMQCKEVFAKDLGSFSVFAGLSHDIIVLLLLSYLQDNYEKDYLFYTQDSTQTFLQDSIGDFVQDLGACQDFMVDSNLDLKNTDLQTAILKYSDMYPNVEVQSCSYIVAENIYINHLQTHKSLSELLAKNSTACKRFIAFLSTKNDSAFLIQDPQNKDVPFQQILDISFSTDLYPHLKALHGYANGDKLIYNFARANHDIVKKWHLQKDELESLGIADFIDDTLELALDDLVLNQNLSFSSNLNYADIKFANAKLPNDEILESRHPNVETKNLLDIFTPISKILDIDKGVLFEANRCVRDRGPRIDYKLVRENNRIVLDYARILRSVMSFKLAGVENELLCFGVVDSLAEFIGTLAGDMLLNYGIKDVFVCGDLLLWQCFLDKIVKALPKNMNVSFPSSGVDFGLA